VISLPAITICFDKIDVLRDDYRKHLNIKDNTNDDENELVKRYLANYTISKQLDMLLNYADIFSSCMVLKSNFDNKNSTNYRDYYTKCDELHKTSIDYDK